MARHRSHVLLLAIALVLAVSAPVRAQEPLSEEAYWEAIRPRLEITGLALDRMAETLSSGTVGTSEWVVELATQVVAVRTMHQEIALLHPPPSLAQFHGIVLDGMSYCRRAMDTLVIAVEQVNNAFVDYASDYMMGCLNSMTTADLMRSQIAVVPFQPAASIATPVPTWTPVPAIMPTAAMNANLHSGPGGDYPVISSAASGQPLTIIGRNPTGDWYQLSDGLWIVASLVSNAPPIDSLPVVAGPPLSQPTPTATVPVFGICPCYGDVMNCTEDFSTQPEAQACYNWCISQGAGDIHDLDRDHDGVACENLPLSLIVE